MEMLNVDLYCVSLVIIRKPSILFTFSKIEVGAEEQNWCCFQVNSSGQSPQVCYYHQVGNQIITFPQKQQAAPVSAAPRPPVPVAAAPAATSKPSVVSSATSVSATPTIVYLNSSMDKGLTTAIPTQIKATIQVHQVCHFE